MNLASKTLSGQSRRYISLMLQGLALSLIGGYVGVMLLVKGLGTPANGASRKSEVLLKGITKLVGDKADPEKVMAYILAAAMGVVVCFGIYYLIKGISQMLPSHTALGKSLLSQAKNYEKFSDIISSIDTDLNQGVQTYGKVSIGREWILSEVAMRISRIRGVFWMDEGEADFIMCCVDEEQNVWAASFTYQDDRERAIQNIKSRFPELVYGDKSAYIAFTESPKI